MAGADKGCPAGIMLASLLRLPAAQALGVETEQASGSSTSGVEGPDDVMQQQVCQARQLFCSMP